MSRVQGLSGPDGSDARVHDQPLPSFDEFFAQHRDRLYRWLCLITRNAGEAEELMQDSFVRVFERWDRVSRMEDPVGYLFRTAMNSFRLLRRRALVASRHLMTLRPREDDLDAVEREDLTLRALGTLSQRQRAVVVLVDMMGYQSDEVASILGLRASTVRVHLARARSALGAELGDEHG
jgi:RNA polymerase sigma-70 factor (ECF subfamily)